MRQANTTYVNLRFTLDELDPFVEASKPVAKRLRPLPRRAAAVRPRGGADRPRHERADPRSRGAANDLTELNRTYPGLKDIALVERPRKIDFGTGPVDVGKRRGAFPELSQALTDSAPDRRPRTPLHDRPVRLVRRLLAHRRLRRARVVQPRADLLQRVHGLRGAPGPAAPAARPGRRLPQDRQAAPGQALPGRQRGARAPDGSNVWSEAEQKELDCVEAAPRHGADRVRRVLSALAVVAAVAAGARAHRRERPRALAEDLRDRVRQRVRARRGRRPQDRRGQGRADDRLPPHRRPSPTA